MQLEVGAAEDPNLAQLRKSNPQMEVIIFHSLLIIYLF